MKNFRFNTICNITQEPVQRYNRACRFTCKSAVIKCHQSCCQKLQVLAGNRFSTSWQQLPPLSLKQI